VRTVYDYFQRANKRTFDRFNGISGAKCVDVEGNSAIFWLESADGRIVAAEYKCTTCCTLVALCEHLAEALTGVTFDDARQWTAEQLLALHPEIPPVRQDRAMLAVSAVQSALQKSMEGACV
jgi:NifU-like protein involved in Fe-S cluster formation